MARTFLITLEVTVDEDTVMGAVHDTPAESLQHEIVSNLESCGVQDVRIVHCSESEAAS